MRHIHIEVTEETFEKWKSQDLSQREIFIRGLYFTQKYQNIELPNLVNKIDIIRNEIDEIKHRLRQVEVK